MASTTAGTGEFPQYSDGDAVVAVSTSKIYKLHSHVLKRVSKHFREIFETIEAPRLTAAARREGHTPWRFVHVHDPRLPSGHGHFVSMQVSDSGRVKNSIPPRGPNNTLDDEDEDRCWDWLFGSFYNISPSFDLSTFGATVRDCLTLLDVAEVIQAADHIREVIDLALMRQDDVLWKSIASDPAIWAELGQRLQSPTIFKEAVVHMVGKWKMTGDEVKRDLPTDILQLCQRKWEELELAKRATEIRMAGHYPPFLCRKHGDKPHRTEYANDIYMWMSLAYFRQYVSQSGNDSKNRRAEDGGYQWYKEFSQGGSAYLDHEDMGTFHQLFPMSKKACNVMEAHMNVLKEDMKSFVKEFMMVRTHVDPAAMEGVTTPWLTCTVVEKEDLPWHVPVDEEGRRANDAAGQMGEEEVEDSGIMADEEDDM